MPIKFRCPHCEQFLGISRSRAGAVTDCPMCGRTIRVPLLDGSVEPLPDPKLNLEDHGLASALDKLAALVTNDPQAMSADDAHPEQPRAQGIIATAPEPVPLPEPIVLQPAPDPVVATPEAHAAAGSPHSGEGLAAREHALASLAGFVAAPRSSDVNRLKQGGGRAWVLAGIGCLLLSLLSFLAGYELGVRGQSPGAAAPNAIEHEVADQPGAAAAPPTPVGEPALAGRILYVDSTGESRPDVGARILVLPEERRGTTRLSADGFRPGADAADLRLAIASVKALGGDYALTEADGSYKVLVPQAGLYQLIVLSRYQPRPEWAAPDAVMLQFLGNYFDRPAQVIGGASAHTSQFRYRGVGTSQRDHSFESL